MIWDPTNECRPREEIRALQLERLQALVQYVYERVPFYRQAMDERGLRPSDIRTLDDVRLLPMTTKEDFRRHYPFGLFAVPLKEVVRLHASSGTTGKPVVVGYTRRDMETWTEVVARMVTCAGVEEGDVAQVVFSYGLFTGGFGLHYGLERVGATVVPAAAGNSKRHIMLMQDFGTTVLVGTPSYVLHLAEVAEEEGIDPRSLPVRLGLFGGEASSREMLREIERRWGMLATDNYGLSEVMGPGVSGECQYQDGQHIAEDHFLVEILDPATGEPCPPGVPGEVVITTLTKEAVPVLRYRTRDISSINYEPCRCGRTSARLGKIQGRTDDMLIIRGINVFPSQVESVLMDIEGVAPHYQLVVSRRGFLDELEVRVEVDERFFTDRFRELEELEEKVVERLHTILQLKARVRLVEPHSIERSEGKARRIIDLRQ
ncbi:phenylacetate--CoA ligase family protein [Thermanaeromonas sp. C210]|uniref:phenylacetate--CoA ligase family protein n=1 Tax=Thermanaeromonas sp. C210 TaxID=2731925 RepID=UPI00155C65F5|nr:phenylacetate--CoA ligase [Thermanaeromonas sp. C210]GFN21899.1 phenylacetate-coenzyme A ligase [Thermanaeromonas sp. C210]